MTPNICTIVASRKTQSSVSYADANQVKLIQAHDTANVAKAKPMIPSPDVVVGEEAGELVGRHPERDDERQVEEQLQRRGGAVHLVRVAAAHRDQAVPHPVGHGRSVGVSGRGQTASPSVSASPVRFGTPSLR